MIYACLVSVYFYSFASHAIVAGMRKNLRV